MGDTPTRMLPVGSMLRDADEAWRIRDEPERHPVAARLMLGELACHVRALVEALDAARTVVVRGDHDDRDIVRQLQEAARKADSSLLEWAATRLMVALDRAEACDAGMSLGGCSSVLDVMASATPGAWHLTALEQRAIRAVVAACKQLRSQCARDVERFRAFANHARNSGWHNLAGEFEEFADDAQAVLDVTNTG